MAVARLRAFFQDPKRNPKRSYTAILDETGNKPTFWQRLLGVYRIHTGRINQPKSVTTIVDANGAVVTAETPSANHAGTFDYATAGIFNAIESFASGNWIETPARRNVWKFFFAPIWAPLNAIRAIYGVVATLFSLIPAGIIHVQQAKAVKAAEDAAALEEQRIQELQVRATAAQAAKPGQTIDMTPTANPAVQPPPLAKRVSAAISNAVPRKSREALNEEVFDKTAVGADPAAFRAKLLTTPVENANSYYKVTETSKEIRAKLVEGKAKHPERYARIEVALADGVKTREASAQTNERITSTVGTLPKKFGKATLHKHGNIITADVVATKNDGKAKFQLFKKKDAATTAAAPVAAPEVKEAKKTVSAIVPRVR